MLQSSYGVAWILNRSILPAYVKSSLLNFILVTFRKRMQKQENIHTYRKRVTNCASMCIVRPSTSSPKHRYSRNLPKLGTYISHLVIQCEVMRLKFNRDQNFYSIDNQLLMASQNSIVPLSSSSVQPYSTMVK